MTASIRKPIPAEHRLFCNHATASVLSEFKRTILFLQNGMKKTTPIMAASSSIYAIGNLCGESLLLVWVLYLRLQIWNTSRSMLGTKNIYHPENRQFPKKKMHLQRFRLLRRVANWGCSCKMSHDCKPKWFPISWVLTPHNRSDKLLHLVADDWYDT